MPGILPMKVIKVGTSSQSRIAQACDRCRSKKIRCDGIRPCCSQCANVGFECRTSDKLSRRAFPRGYTESLEERVRQLEAEVHELKDLLDEKDEKIDMLSKMHSNRRHQSASQQYAATAATSSPNAMSSVATPASSSSSTASTNSDGLSHQSPSASPSSLSPEPNACIGSIPKVTAGKTGSSSGAVAARAIAPAGSRPGSESRRDSRLLAVPAPKEDTFRVQPSPLLLGVENSDSYFMGPSSGRPFIDIFKRKIQESGKSCPDFYADAFLHIQGCYPLVEKLPPSSIRVPPRLFSDRCVNVYFQEWSPLFPVLHRPAFLRIYDEFVSDVDKVKNHHKLAQLHLVFAIAALSSDQPDMEQIAVCEQQWQRSLETVLMDNTIITLQCLVLALLYCTVRADYKRLQYYKGIAIGLSHRLGLHQSQKRFSFGALTIETRKKVFWTLYTLDCFSAAVMGLPKLLKDDDIHTEYPVDADDEYVTEKGFQPTLPGECTRLSSALALFRASRILARVLETVYPASATHELSLQQMGALDVALGEWRDALPPHLTLTFRQEKPSTDVTGNRSPLLSLTYYYIRTLIWRPAIGSSLGCKAAPAVMAVSEASKHMVQVVELLDERKMSFSLCLNKSDLLLVCGMALLYQSMDLKQDSKMLKDSERLVNVVVKSADHAKAPGSRDFKSVAAMLVTLDDMSVPPAVAAPTGSDAAMPAPARHASLTGGQQRKAQTNQLTLGRLGSASVSETDLIVQQERLRRMTMPASAVPTGNMFKNASLEQRSHSRASFDSLRDQTLQHHRPPPPMSQAQILARVSPTQQQQRPKNANNMDYISVGADGNLPSHSQPSSPVQARNTQQQQQQHQQQQQQQRQQQQQQRQQQQQQHLQQQQHQHQNQQYYGATQSQKASSSSGVTPADWEALLSSMDGGQLNVYDAIYGGPAIGLSSDATPQSATSQSGDGLTPESWDVMGMSLADLVGGPGSHSSGPGSIPPPAQSVLSFSDESMSSVGGDDLAAADLANLGLSNLDLGGIDYRSNGGLIPEGCGPAPEGFVVEGMPRGYVL